MSTRRLSSISLRLLALVTPALPALGCGSPEPGSDGAEGTGSTGATSAFPTTGISMTGEDGMSTSADTVGTGGETSGSDSTAGDTDGVVAEVCPITFRYEPAPGTSLQQVVVAGEWDGFAPTGTPLAGPAADGSYEVSLELPPGTWAYKFVLDGSNWILDPRQGYRKYVDGLENSAMRVPDCNLPALEVVQTQSTRASAGAGRFTATVKYEPGVAGRALDPAGTQVVLQHHGAEQPLDAWTYDAATGEIAFDVQGLGDGKYTIEIVARDTDGRAGEPVRLVFWIEAEAFEWRDAIIYMVMTDRFRDGDPSNNAPPTPGVQDPRTDWYGGDLQGLLAELQSGRLDELGVRAIWLSPFQMNPQEPFLAADAFHQVTGYHGYWPTRAREVDPRYGGEEALRAVIDEAHRHGIRVLMDFVINHVHEQHEYFVEHPEWFRTGCVCGTAGCDWTEQRLECLFAEYMPDVDWTVPEAGEQIIADALWWLDEFDLDGLRVDAVKHVEDAAISNLSVRVKEGFETAGTDFFLMGETAMGWSDCSVECNQSQYDTIGRYVGEFGLDGQFDFVLYHGVPYRVFAYDERGMLHADFWTKTSLEQYPEGSVMTPFIGSHDSPRFSSLATYRGQPGFESGVPGNQWSNLAGPPNDSEPFARHALALTWVLTLPGAPLLYYGDEYGQWGGADPGNRAMWKGHGDALSSDEQNVLTRVRAVGTARRELAALRRGGYRTLHATEDFLAFARAAESSGEVAIVALARSPHSTTHEVTIPLTLGLPSGTVLDDHLGGSDVVVQGNTIQIELPAWGAAILSP